MIKRSALDWALRYKVTLERQNILRFSEIVYAPNLGQEDFRGISTNFLVMLDESTPLQQAEVVASNLALSQEMVSLLVELSPYYRYCDKVYPAPNWPDAALVPLDAMQKVVDFFKRNIAKQI